MAEQRLWQTVATAERPLTNVDGLDGHRGFRFELDADLRKHGVGDPMRSLALFATLLTSADEED